MGQEQASDNTPSARGSGPFGGAMLWRWSKSASPLEFAVTKNASASLLECASMRHAPVSISFSTRDLLSFFSFRAHLLGGGRRPPERTRLNSAVRHQLGSRFVLPWGSTDDSGGPGRDHSSIRARWLMRTASLSPHSGCPEPGEAGGPITYSAPLGGTRSFSGTPRVSTPAPELLVIDAFLQHAVQAQHQLARHRHHRSEEHTSELQSRLHLVCRLLLEK